MKKTFMFHQKFVFRCLTIFIASNLLTACDDESKDKKDNPDRREQETESETNSDAGLPPDTETDTNVIDPNEKALVDFIEETMDEMHFPGVAVAVAADQEVVWSKGFGYADIESEEPVTPDTPFRIASISKTFIATALMQLEEEGKIDIDDDINSFGLPFTVRHPSFPDDTITLRNISNHTSGILDDMEGAYYCSFFMDSTEEVLLNALAPGTCPELPSTELGPYLEAYLTPEGALYNAEVNFSSAEDGAPGTFFDYSNVAAALAAYAIGTKTGTDFDEHCEQEIFAPLEMTNTHWHYSEFDDDTTPVTQYEKEGSQLFPLPRYSIPTWPDGGLKSSANDLGKYMTAMMNGGILDGTRILSEDKVEEMLASQTDDLTERGILELVDYFGTFWIGAGGLIGHTGGDPGITTYMFFHPEDKVGVVVLINTSSEIGSPDGDAVEEIMVKALVYGYGFTS